MSPVPLLLPATRARVLRARRAWQQLVVDPLVGLAGGMGYYRSPSRVITRSGGGRDDLTR